MEDDEFEKWEILLIIKITLVVFLCLVAMFIIAVKTLSQ